ncbi:MAG: hypothetical protein IPM27_12265 [Nitrosomonadales bacterium]|nr:hypothetical protein [Nitrosomonadales bacterium]
MIAGRYFSGMLIATMFVCLGQASAATVTSTIRVTATTVQTLERAGAGDDDDFDLQSANRISRQFERRIRLVPGHAYHIVLEGRAARHWEYVRETGSVIVVRRRAGASLFDLSERLTIGISY